MNMTKTDSLAKASKDLMLKEPFYGFFLMNLNKMWDDKTPTASVGLRHINYELRLGPEFWEELTPDQHKGLLKHELCHIGFFHLTDYAHYYTIGGMPDREKHMIMNIAQDIEINQYIQEDWLPPGPQLPSTYPELDLGVKEGTISYYKKLLEAKENGSSPSLDKMLSAAGAGDSTCELDGKDVQVPSHKWDESDGLDEATKKLLKSHTAHVIKQVADQVTKSRGVVPGEFSEIIRRLNSLEKAKFDWKGYIRRFAGKSVKVYTKKTRRKLNRRNPEEPGLKIKQQKHLLIGIDTSGSVSTNELKEFLNEIYHMQKTGSEVTIMQYDSAISSIKRFNHRDDFVVTGRGGTCFQPGVDYYNEHIRDFSCFINFTDGEAPAPDNGHGDILWVHSSQSEINEDLPGSKIKLEL